MLEPFNSICRGERTRLRPPETPATEDWMTLTRVLALPRLFRAKVRMSSAMVQTLRERSFLLHNVMEILPLRSRVVT